MSRIKKTFLEWIKNPKQEKLKNHYRNPNDCICNEIGSGRGFCPYHKTSWI